MHSNARRVCFRPVLNCVTFTIASLFLSLSCSTPTDGQEVQQNRQSIAVESPNQTVHAELDLIDGQLQWSLTYEGSAVFNASPIRLYQGDEKNRKQLVFSSISSTTKSVDKNWRPTFGQQAEVHDARNELTWTLMIDDESGEKVDVDLAVFNDGIGIRYRPSSVDTLFSDNTGFHFAGDFTFWAANGERPNHGPVKLSQWKSGSIQAPMVMEAANDVYCGVLEAAIYDQYPFAINRNGGPLKFQTTALPAIFPSQRGTAWRVVTLGHTAGDLITNEILGNLNPPLALDDVSWIKPGLALWDWRAWGATTPDGFEYGLDMASWKRFIDFAASKKNIRYLLLDANWYGPEFDPNEDPTTSRDHLVEQIETGDVVRKPAPENWSDPIDVPALIEYANDRGVGVVLYINDHARKKFDFEKTLAIYEKWGAAGIKFGFMATKGNRKVQETREIIELCAKHRLVCNFHDGPIPGSGDTRTYPNYLTREFCHAQSDGKRSFSPETFCTTVFVNMLTGPLDMNNGLYAIQDAEKARPRIFKKVNTTVVGETARILICFSGMAIIPDIPEAYEAKADLFKFIEAMPMTWDETKVLHGKIGDHISIARRTKDTWLIGSACDENGTTLPIELSFLEKGKTYRATVFEDTSETHFETNPEDYSIRQLEVSQDDTIDATLAPGGGHCILIEPRMP